MTVETTTHDGIDWPRLGRRVWPVLWAVVIFVVPFVERGWERHEVKRESMLTAPADQRRRLKARVLRVDPPIDRKDWTTPRGPCDSLEHTVSWTVCWEPDGVGFKYALVFAYGGKGDDPDQTMRALLWVFAPAATSAERDAAMALVASGQPGSATAGGMAFVVEPERHNSFILKVAPIARSAGSLRPAS